MRKNGGHARCLATAAALVVLWAATGAGQPAAVLGPPSAEPPPQSPPPAEPATCPSAETTNDDEPAAEIKPTFQLRGRIHADTVIVNQSSRNRAIIGDLQDATGFRRARLGAQGYVGEQVNWVAEFDFAGGFISFKDVWIGLDDLPIVRRVRVGHLREPFGLEALTSSNYIPFIE